MDTTTCLYKYRYGQYTDIFKKLMNMKFQNEQHRTITGEDAAETAVNDPCIDQIQSPMSLFFGH